MLRVKVPWTDCLKTVYTLDPMGAGTRMVDIALALGATLAATRSAVRRLEAEGLVERFGKNRVGLTMAGRGAARELRSRYEVIRLYFVENLRVDSKTAAREAGRLQHTLGDESLNAMRQAVAHNDDWGELAALMSA